jgi:hypothetical protein
VIDLRNIYRPEEMHSRGFAYVCVGRSFPLTTFTDDASLDRVVAKVRMSTPTL